MEEVIQSLLDHLDGSAKKAEKDYEISQRALEIFRELYTHYQQGLIGEKEFKLKSSKARKQATDEWNDKFLKQQIQEAQEQHERQIDLDVNFEIYKSGK